MAQRFESRPVDQDIPPLETASDTDPSYEPPEPQYEPEPRRPNIFTDNAASNNPSGRGKRPSVSCSLSSQRVGTDKEAIHRQREINRQLKENN